MGPQASHSTHLHSLNGLALGVLCFAGVMLASDAVRWLAPKGLTETLVGSSSDGLPSTLAGSRTTGSRAELAHFQDTRSFRDLFVARPGQAAGPVLLAIDSKPAKTQSSEFQVPEVERAFARQEGEIPFELLRRRKFTSHWTPQVTARLEPLIDRQGTERPRFNSGLPPSPERLNAALRLEPGPSCMSLFVAPNCFRTIKASSPTMPRSSPKPFPPSFFA